LAIEPLRPNESPVDLLAGTSLSECTIPPKDCDVPPPKPRPRLRHRSDDLGNTSGMELSRDKCCRSAGRRKHQHHREKRRSKRRFLDIFPGSSSGYCSAIQLAPPTASPRQRDVGSLSPVLRCLPRCLPRTIGSTECDHSYLRPPNDGSRDRRDQCLDWWRVRSRASMIEIVGSVNRPACDPRPPVGRHSIGGLTIKVRFSSRLTRSVGWLLCPLPYRCGWDAYGGRWRTRALHAVSSRAVVRSCHECFDRAGCNDERDPRTEPHGAN
jgi:hypothetical protein